MSTIKMRLVGAIVVGGEIIKPPAVVEVIPAEAANLLRRGKAVVATEEDHPSATSPSAENAKGGNPPDGDGDDPLKGATADNPVDAVVHIGNQSVDVQVIGTDDGAPVVTDASADAIEAAALREQANAAAAAVDAAKAKAAEVEGKNRAQKAADKNAVSAAEAAHATAEAAALAAEAKLIPAT